MYVYFNIMSNEINGYKILNKLNYRNNLVKFIKTPTDKCIEEILKCYGIYNYNERTEIGTKDFTNIVENLEILNLESVLQPSYFYYLKYHGNFIRLICLLKRVLLFKNYGIKVKYNYHYTCYGTYSIINYENIDEVKVTQRNRHNYILLPKRNEIQEKPVQLKIHTNKKITINFE